MSTRQLSTARAIWRSRRERADGAKAYTFYVSGLVTLIVIAPIVGVLWNIASSPTGLESLASPDAVAVVSTVTATLWSGALLAGRKRGPALLPPFLLHALAGSDVRRSRTLRRPVVVAAAIIMSTTTALAVLIGMALLSGGYADLWGVTIFGAAALSVGAVTATLWLAGQAFHRTVFPIALTMLALAGASLLVPQLLVIMPWGWVGATYPLAGPGSLSLALTVVLGTVCVFVSPVMLGRLTGMQLTEQAGQWERVTAFSSSFDLRGATSVYQAAPKLGRTLRAVLPHRRRWVTFLIRDAVGLARTPGRGLGAMVTTAAAGALMTLSLLPGAPAFLLAGIAGVVIFAASGPLSTGLQHAANVAGDYPLYGVSDRGLVRLHATLPLAAVLAVLSASASVVAIVTGVPLGLALLVAGAAGVLAVALRLASALKGSLPTHLLMPIDSPVGDLSIAMRIGWAISDPALAILGALAIAALPITPFPLAALSMWVGLLVSARWQKRR